MNLSPLIVLGILGLDACAASAPSAAKGTADTAGATPRARLTCEEQAARVQPPPTGDSREQYVWGCLIEHQFAAYVWERQSCEADAECTIVQTVCPFGCGVAVARTYATDVSAEHGRLLMEFNKREDCMYKCNPVVAVTCTQHRCTPRHLMEKEPSESRP
jgi:hypothetical protein